jgi:hypothetical protein
MLYRCAAEPVDAFVAKGGPVEATVGRRCLCNGLLADIGLGQVRGASVEPPLATSGDDLASLARFGAHYTAADVVEWLRGGAGRRRSCSGGTAPARGRELRSARQWGASYAARPLARVAWLAPRGSRPFARAVPPFARPRTEARATCRRYSP